MGEIKGIVLRLRSREVGMCFLLILIVFGFISNANSLIKVRATDGPTIDSSATVAVPAQTAPAPQIAPPKPSCAVVPCIALTFDDGPNPIATPLVLQALEQAQVQATFFVVGSRAATMPGLLQQMYRDGDEIGNHSWSHPNLTTLPADQIAQQISQTQDAVVGAGVPAPTLFRPPYGAVNDLMRNEINLPIIMWNDDPDDWEHQNPPQVIASAEAQARPGAIVDLHDIYTSTGQALPQLLSDLKQHYQLVTVSELLNLQPGQRGEFFAR